MPGDHVYIYEKHLSHGPGYWCVCAELHSSVNLMVRLLATSCGIPNSKNGSGTWCCPQSWRLQPRYCGMVQSWWCWLRACAHCVAGRMLDMCADSAARVGDGVLHLYSYSKQIGSYQRHTACELHKLLTYKSLKLRNNSKNITGIFFFSLVKSGHPPK